MVDILQDPASSGSEVTPGRLQDALGLSSSSLGSSAVAGGVNAPCQAPVSCTHLLSLEKGIQGGNPLIIDPVLVTVVAVVGSIPCREHTHAHTQGLKLCFVLLPIGL